MTTRRSRAMSLSADWDNVFGKRDKDKLARHPGFNKIEKPSQTFCTGSVYSGGWNVIGMAGFGTFTFPHKVEYEGTLEDSQFNGDGTLQYPMGQKIEGTWDKGHLVSWKFRFEDGLEYDVPWTYCKFPDRRYNLSLQEGLRPPNKELLTNAYVPREIPEGCYDTGDGFYDPKIKCVISAVNRKTVLRIPTMAEEKWIMDNCRKAWDEPVGYRPDLYSHWCTGKMDENREEVDEEIAGHESDDEDDGIIERLMPAFTDRDDDSY